MGSIEILNSRRRPIPIRYSLLKDLHDYLDEYCSGSFIFGIVNELNEGSLDDIIFRPRLSDEFLEKLLDFDFPLWYQTTLFMEQVHHNFIRSYLLHYFGKKQFGILNVIIHLNLTIFCFRMMCQANVSKFHF